MKKTLYLFSACMVMFSCAISEITQKPAILPENINTESDPTELVQQEIETLFYPMPPQQPRLQFLVSITRDPAQRISNKFNKFSLGETELFIQIDRPYDMGAVKGKVYISDMTLKKVLILDLEKKEVGQIEADYESVGIWVTEDDYKYVADFAGKQILVFNDNNNLVRVYAYRNQFEKPLDVAVYENKVYVCDINKHQIIVLDKDSGKTTQVIGGIGTKEGKFYKPTHVVVDKKGNLYVNDFFNFRIQKFDNDGNFLKAFGYAGDTLGGFARPKGLAIDREGHLYVVDAAFENVQIFDDNSADLLLFFGGFGLDPGSMYLPNGIYIDYHNTEYFTKYVDNNFSLKYLVYVGNTLGPVKVNVYGFGEWVGAPLQGVKGEERNEL